MHGEHKQDDKPQFVLTVIKKSFTFERQKIENWGPELIFEFEMRIENRMHLNECEDTVDFYVRSLVPQIENELKVTVNVFDFGFLGLPQKL